MLVEMKGIVMDFGPVRAVNNVDFSIDSKDIVGLLGENGAGKSTLMNVLAGALQPTKGEIFIDGKKVHIANAHVAGKYGIRFIHQELNLCNELTVVENMFLAQEITKNGITQTKEMINRCVEVFDRMNVKINPMSPVSDLQAAEKQLLEIAKSLLFESKLIIMDEPTTALSTNEIENLFNIMRQLSEEGVSFIFISHKMPELFEICKTYFIMRDGNYVSQGNFKDIVESEITEMMIGHNLAEDSFDNKENHSKDKVVLSVKNFSSELFHDINFELHSGEILAITGLQGSGREAIADALFGAEKYSGTIEIDGYEMKKGSKIINFMKRGVALVPRMRKERGIFNDLSIYDNMSMAYFNTKLKKLLISDKEENQRFTRQQSAMKIKVGNPNNPITSLSGGNQQKVILGRWLEADAGIMLFDNPTQGIDVGAKFEIYHLILELARQGKGIIVFSAEFPEIYKVADRCLVLYKGQIMKEMNRDELNEKDVMLYSTGVNKEVATNV
ncbi:sugar ABC transporter ATP-binding protein [Anaerorhabdus furcosa]|uniref:Ribose transport system ATP-binding protein n=1 Tax=Anaerorhabdus furcosa TaxID=118967 RepID=A0A1T4MCA5_9FIRM|nr:sugar ABC transporter ATP-binding protein [Anaerorhabdus furcosa]SJZ64505.1 ribose transport system ATP-binding protein [Anaerorhabdus furcosa]